MEDDDAAWDVFARIKDGDEPQPQPELAEFACMHCGSRDVELRDGMFECLACHTLVDRFLDHSAEWRCFFGGDECKATDPTRCSPPGSGTILTTQGHESFGQRMMRKYQMWNAMTYRERTLYNIFDTLAIQACKNSIPACILEEAKVLYRRVTENRISRGENRSALIACSIYMSCKTNKVPRSVKEIADMFDLKLTAMTKGCKLFQEILGVNVQCSTPEDFVNRFCSRLNLGKHVAEAIKNIVRRADDLSIACESTPPSVVAGALFLCNAQMNLGLSKKDLCAVCQVSPVTVNKCHRKLATHADLLLLPAKT
jgi:transcription initiation factor TFIIB